MLTLVGGVSSWCHAAYRVYPVERVGLVSLGKRYSGQQRDAAKRPCLLRSASEEKPPKTPQDEQTDACPCLDKVDMWR